MGERKVQAKYYPPDFDPSKLPRIRKKTTNDDAVRFMLPMSVRCSTCGEFMGAGLKFNARKSDTGETYLGIRIFRFSMRCKGCPATFTIRTDPQNRNYSCETGVRRNYEPWREKEQIEEEGKEERKRQDEDRVQALENKTKDAKQEMEDLDELDEIKNLNAKRARVDMEAVLERDRRMREEREEEVDREVQQEAVLAFQQKNVETLRTILVPSAVGVRRQHTDYESKTTNTDSRPYTLRVVKKIRKVNHSASASTKLDSELNGTADSSATMKPNDIATELVGYASSSDSDG